MSQQTAVGGRPRSVTIAVMLMWAVAAGYLADAVWVIAGAGSYSAKVQRELDAIGLGDLGAVKSTATTLPYVAAAITIVAAVVLVGIASAVRSGSNAGRILAWIAIGLSLTCGFCGLMGSGTPGFSGVFFFSAFNRGATGTQRFAERLPDAYPAAYRWVSGTFFVLSMLALILVIVLLARAPANRYFRPAPVYPPYPQAPAGWVPGWSPTLTPAQNAALAELVRSHQRGELSDEQFAAARQRMLGHP
jgi:hypothetical protein